MRDPRFWSDECGAAWRAWAAAAATVAVIIWGVVEFTRGVGAIAP